MNNHTTKNETAAINPAVKDGTAKCKNCMFGKAANEFTSMFMHCTFHPPTPSISYDESNGFANVRYGDFCNQFTPKPIK